VAQAIFGKLLEFVRGPMSEIEGTGGTEFERIARGGDVVQVQFGGTMNEALHRGGIEIAQAKCIALDRFEEFGVANERDFHRFDVAGAFVARFEGFEQFEIVDDGEGWSERADEILFAERVDAVFHADAGIVLAQGCGRNANVTDATMRGGCGETDHVKKRAAADGDDVGMTIDMETIDLRMDFGDVKIRILRALASFDDDRRANEMEFGMGGEILFDVADEERLRMRKSFIDYDDGFVARARGAGAHDVMQQRIIEGEHAIGEVHLVAIAHLYVSLDTGHRNFSMPNWT
jgi:hypothetical protein